MLQTLDLQHRVALMLFVNSVAENAVAARILMQDNDPKKVLEMSFIAVHLQGRAYLGCKSEVWIPLP